MSSANMSMHISLEESLGDNIQILQMQAIDQEHKDNKGLNIFVINLSKVDKDYPIVRFDVRARIVEGDAELKMFDTYYPGLASDSSYIYVLPSIVSPNIKVELI